ncbi:4'-phosphopantetheinyl transferase [Rhizobium sp. PP-F2F-G20b]|nr:4'-phosphopantetheinyl transferase [Rhizobium sp. PP-F2F-G20b]
MTGMADTKYQPNDRTPCAGRPRLDESTLPWSGIARLVLHHEDGEASGSCIDVSTLPTDALSVEQMELFRSWLSDHETIRAERFLHAEDRRDFVAAHALLRFQLRHHFPELPFPARIAADGQGGKPHLLAAHNSDGTAIDFNISHTRGMVACVTASDHDDGIDCEPLARMVDAGLAEVCFSELECHWLTTQGCLTPPSAFLHLWTLKEAVTKALGTGLAIDLKTFSVLPFPPRITETSPEIGEHRRWSFRQWVSKDGFIVAMAARNKNGRPNIETRGPEPV